MQCPFFVTLNLYNNVFMEKMLEGEYYGLVQVSSSQPVKIDNT